MNNNDLNRLIEALQEKKKYSGFDRFLLLYDDVVFKEVQNRKIVLNKRFLLDNLSPGAVQYLVELNSLTLSELADIFKYVENRLSQNLTVPAFSNVKIFQENLIKAISHMTQEDVLSIYTSSLFQTRCESLFNNFTLGRTGFMHLTAFDAEGITKLSNFDDANNLPVFICSNIINSLCLLENEDLEKLSSNEKVLSYLKFCASSFMTYDTKQDSAFLLGLIDENIWSKLPKSDVFAKLFFKLFELDNLIRSPKTFNLYSRWSKFAKKAYTFSPYNNLLKIIAYGFAEDLDSMHANSLPINFEEYVFEKMRTYELLKNENIVQLQADNVNIAELIVLKCIEENFDANCLIAEDKETISIDVFNSYKKYSDKEDFICLENKQKVDFKNISPTDKLQILNWVLLKISGLGLTQSMRNNVFSIVSKELLHSYLDEANKNFKNSNKRFIPRIAFNLNGQEIQYFLEAIVSWQENNMDSDLIEWSYIYMDVYALNDLDFKCFHLEVMKRFAVCVVKRLLLSENGGILSLSLQNLEDSFNKIDDKWLCYSPNSSLLEPLFREYNLNTAILFSKLALRAGKECAIEEDLFDQAVLRLSQNNKVYKYSLEKMFPEINFRDLSMLNNFIEINKNNVFTTQIENSSRYYQNILSCFPIFSDLVEDKCEEFSDETIISLLKNANFEYIPEVLLEEAFNRKLYLLVDFFAVFFQKAEDIINFRMLDSWKKQAFIDMANTSLDHPISIPGLSVWDYFFEYYSLEDYSKKVKNEEFNIHLSEKRKQFCSFLNKQNQNSEDVFKLNTHLWSKDKFKRSVQFLQSGFLLEVIFRHSDIFENSSYELFQNQIEHTHINMSKSFIEPLFQEAMRDLPPSPASFEFTQMDLRAKFAIWLMSISSQEIKNIYWPKIIYDMPELLYSDIFNVPELESLISAIPFEDIVSLTEKAVNESYLMAGEFVCREYFKNVFQKRLYSEPGKYLEVFRYNPVGFAFLNLLPAMTTQNKVSGWSLSLNNVNCSIFLTGLKKIINKLVELSNKHNDVVLQSLIDALKNGGSTITLIRKPLLMFLRDNHLYLYLAMIDALGDENTYEDFQLKFNRSLMSQKIELFEEFFLSTKKNSYGRQLIVPIDRIYRDRNNCQSYHILYEFLKNSVISEEDLNYLISKFKFFMERYPTIYFDLAVKSVCAYCENVQTFKNFFIAISDEIFENIIQQRKLNSIIYNQIQKNNQSDNLGENDLMVKL